MKSGCCSSQNSDVVATKRSWANLVRRAVSWIVPGIVLAAMPKCPLCLAAYVAVFTGFGISLAAAQFAWWAVAVGCVAALAYVAITSGVHAVRRLGRDNHHRPKMGGN